MVLFHLYFFFILYLLTLHQLIFLHWLYQPSSAAVHHRLPSIVAGRCQLPSSATTNCHRQPHCRPRPPPSAVASHHCFPPLALSAIVWRRQPPGPHCPPLFATIRCCRLPRLSQPAVASRHRLLSSVATACHCHSPSSSALSATTFPR